MNESDEVVVWGGGAIGGTVAAFAARSGLRVCVVDVATDHLAAINERGLAIEGPLASFVVQVETAVPEDVRTPLKTVFLAVKSQHTADACRAILPRLDADGVIVSLQNGLNHLAIAPVVGRQRTLPALVDFDADYMRPGVIAYLGTGNIVVGELDGAVTSRAQQVAEWLAATGSPVTLSSSIEGYLWSKLAFTAVVAATALTDDPMVDCFASSDLAPLFRSLVAEVLDVASAVGIKAQPFGAFEPTTLQGENVAQAIRVFADIAAGARHSAKTYSGIWRDIAVRHRQTEVRALFEPVVSYARSFGIATPGISRLITLIAEVESGSRSRRRQNLAFLAQGIVRDRA
jgi:2-dehydropantoate 2-reductase